MSELVSYNVNSSFALIKEVVSNEGPLLYVSCNSYKNVPISLQIPRFTGTVKSTNMQRSIRILFHSLKNRHERESHENSPTCCAGMSPASIHVFRAHSSTGIRIRIHLSQNFGRNYKVFTPQIKGSSKAVNMILDSVYDT